jgi:conjugative relaxase-like TrwC/TraI family protein
MKGGIHFYRGSGAGAEKYFDEVPGRSAGGSAEYYTEEGRVVAEIDAWQLGRRVSMTVEAERGSFAQWVEGVDPATGEVKGCIRAGGPNREPLRFVEVVVNNPKSLSVVASQNPVIAAALDRTLARQADEVAKRLSSVAVTRVGPRGAQRDVGGLVVETARVSHLTSREGDPHRHVHLMLNTRVKAPDGSWRGLHSAAIRQHISAINQLGSRVLATDIDLATVLAGEGYTLGMDGEIDQARGAVALMSKRSAQVGQNREAIEQSWREAHPDREPSQRVRNGWDRKAWATDRAGKPHVHESPGELSERVRVELAAAGFDFTPGARSAVELVGLSVGQVDRDHVAAEAIAVLSGHKSAWSQADLSTEVEAAVAASGVVGDPQAVTELAEDCRARAEALCLSLLDPERQSPTAMSRHLTSETVIDADMRLNLGLAGLAGGGGRDRAAVLAGHRLGLDDGQSVALSALCGSQRLEVVVGPAGTGKTAMLAAAAERLAADGRELVVVAPTRKGALVAGAEVGVEGTSLSKLVHEHGFRWDELSRWSRLAVGDLDPATGRPYRGPSASAVLSPRSVVVVDEAGLATVDQTNALIDVCAGSGASLRLVGDPRQLGAVGRGGVIETAARWAGGPAELDQVHRFLRLRLDEAGLAEMETDTEYAELSLAMRTGDDPATVVDRLADRGSVVVHASPEEAIAVIATQVITAGGKDGALTVTVATNDEVGRINRAVREQRVRLGMVDDNLVVVAMGGERIGAGDRIVTRKNDTARDVANRETWVVESISRDGEVTASNGFRRVRLDGGYVSEAVQLGYASTDYGNQGVTTDRSVTWVGGATTTGGMYVGATRGRYENTIHVVAEDTEAARDQLIAALGRDRADRGLAAARGVAEAEAVTVTKKAAERSALADLVAEIDPVGPVDPADWRTEAELVAAERWIDAAHLATETGPALLPVLSDEARAQARRADLVAVDADQQLARQHRAEIGRLEAGRPDRRAEAIADFFAAREADRVITAGPGRLGRKADQVEAATAHRAEIAGRWGPGQLPGLGWIDGAVRGEARRRAEAIVASDVERHASEAARAERDAAERQRASDVREAHQARAREANEREATQWVERREMLDRARAQIAGERETRDQRIVAMSPTDVAQADQARIDLLAQRAAEATAAAAAKTAQAAKAAKEAAEMLRSRRIVSVLDDGYTHHHDPGGPSLGFGR